MSYPSGRKKLVDYISQQYNLPLINADECVKAVEHGIVEVLMSSGKVNLRNVGVLEVMERPTRIQNIYGREKVVPASRNVVFRASARLNTLLSSYGKENQEEEA